MHPPFFSSNFGSTVGAGFLVKTAKNGFGSPFWLTVVDALRKFCRGFYKDAAASQASVAATPALRRYHTRVSPVPPSPPHPKPSRRAPPSKRARTSSQWEPSSFRPQEPQSPANQGRAGALPLDLSPALITRRPYFYCSPISRNTDCSARDLHS